MISEQAVISQGEVQLKKGLELSMHDAEKGVDELCTEKENNKQYKKWTRELVELQKDPRVDRQTMKEFDRKFETLIA